jgi:hypothetical protein
MKLQLIENKSRSDQYLIYLPLKIVNAMNWNKGDIFNIEVLGKDKIKIEKVKL